MSGPSTAKCRDAGRCVMARPSRQNEIGIWLKGLLSAGRRKAEDVIAAAVTAGYATNPDDGTRTLRRVKLALGIKSEQHGEIWYWRDPAIAVLPNEKTEPVVETVAVETIKKSENTPGLYMPV